MTNLQERAHPDGHDYDAGSPHLKHDDIREMISKSLRDAVTHQIKIKGKCIALEIGAGHGCFTQILVDAGASVIVTEMSLPSADKLKCDYLGSKSVIVYHDDTGNWLGESDMSFDLIACISVLHHIPDYLGFMEIAFDHITENGTFISWQDPLWYPRRTRLNLVFEKICYYSWRLTQKNLLSGLRTRLRRLQGILDENNPADMVEYHVVRNGLDEQEILRLSGNFFERARLRKYFSTQNMALQKYGQHEWAINTFGVILAERNIRSVRDQVE